MVCLCVDNDLSLGMGVRFRNSQPKKAFCFITHDKPDEVKTSSEVGDLREYFCVGLEVGGT